MKRVEQVGPTCWRASLASILAVDLNVLPSWIDSKACELTQFGATRELLRRFDVDLDEEDFDPPRLVRGDPADPAEDEPLAIGYVTINNPGDHAVVVAGDRVVHDPGVPRWSLAARSYELTGMARLVRAGSVSRGLRNWRPPRYVP